MGYESKEIKDVRINIYKQIQECWPDNLSESDKNYILRRLSGPSIGAWSKDIYHDLVLGLVQDQKIESDESILFWINILLEKIEGSKGGYVTFYAPTDILLTELCASILPNLSKESWNEKVKQFRKLINKCNREVRRPFEKSNNFHNWNKVKKQGLWLKAFFELAYPAANDKKTDIAELLNRMDKKLMNSSDSTDQDLYGFANQTTYP